MKIIRPYARILFDSTSSSLSEAGLPQGYPAMRKIEWCARISHRSEEAQGENSWRRFIETVVIGHGDWSVVEHVSITVDAVVDRGITHEWVRHRLFGFTQESTRFVNYEKKIPPAFIYPKPEVECRYCIMGVEHDLEGERWEHLQGEDFFECPYHHAWLDHIKSCEKTYRLLLKDGWRPQEARSVFPNALASRIVTTGNLRQWRHCLIMRTAAEAHPQMRQVTIPLLAEFQSAFPILFDDIIPNQKQSEAMKKAR